MPLSKAHTFDHYYQSIALTGRALAHPARVRIIEILSENACTTNLELTAILALSKTSVHNHIRKLEEAGLVQADYGKGVMSIQLNPLTSLNIDRFLNTHFSPFTGEY